ncbi:triacylglycerol lipase [Trifolium repens]|nr:triacylglycerol lipase [Trifolium repens]
MAPRASPIAPGTSSAELTGLSRCFWAPRANCLRRCANFLRRCANFRFSSCFLFKSLRLEPTLIRTGQIAKYDYNDEIQNMLHYGQRVPPIYDITKIPSEFPLFLGYGGKDYLSDVQDVNVLLNDLNDHDADKLVLLFTDDYAHVDYIAGFNAKQVVYDPMIAFLNFH